MIVASTEERKGKDEYDRHPFRGIFNATVIPPEGMKWFKRKRKVIK